MNILFVLSHPAQFHFAKNMITILQNDGHKVLVLMKTKDILEDLIQEKGWKYVNIQPNVRKNNKLAMAMATVQRTIRVVKWARKFKADILIGTDASVAQAGKILNKVALTTLEDDAEIIPKLVKLTYPFTSHILVPKVCSVGKWEAKKIGYDGYMKLAYLHPNRFQSDKTIVQRYIKEEKYCLIRLAKLVAHHDEGIAGLTMIQVQELVNLIEQNGYKVYIHSEIKLPSELESYHLNIASSDMHHILANASLLISDSQSMSVEAAMLGVPSVRFSDFSGRISVLEELEQKYKLTFGIKTSEPNKLFEKVKELLCMPNMRATFQQLRNAMLSDKIDVTAFFVWFIENYPESKHIMRENPDYQNTFK